MQRAELLHALLQALELEDRALCDLISLSGEMMRALMANDSQALEAVTGSMRAGSEAIESLELERLRLTAQLGSPDATLTDIAPIAAALGVPGFEEISLRLRNRAADLQEAQEQNARLVLGAARLQERWFNLLAGMAADTYGAGGQQELRQARAFVSKSA